MEKVSYLLNGQWVLEKWSLKDIGNAVEWTESGMHRFLNELPKAKGAMRRSMLKDLETDMDKYNRAPGLQIRVNPQTNKKEYLLHRLQNVLPSNKASSDQPRSWSHSKDFCHLWSLGQDSPTRIISAWIPEDHIHSYLPTASKIQSPYYDYKDEGEVLVLPHKLNIVNIEHPRPPV